MKTSGYGFTLLSALIFCCASAQASTCGGYEGDDDAEYYCARDAIKSSNGHFQAAVKFQEKGELDAMCDKLLMAHDEVFPYTTGDWRDYKDYADRVHTAVKSLVESVDAMEKLSWAELKKQKCPQIIARYKGYADEGDVWGQYHLAEAYATGEGIAQNSALAVEWHQKAIAQGDTDSMKMLAKRYSEGDGVPLDQTKAFELWLMAAKVGLESDGIALRGAQQEVAVRYHKGIGVTQNFEQAAYWYKQSKDKGNEWAGDQLEAMYKSGQVKKPLLSW
jgi:TPR repeat protein